MAIKGFQKTKTKAQDLAEIVYKQDGFLTGLNLDSPKSDVGDTQLTVAKNVIPYRDRIEVRGGLIPLTGYEQENFGSTNPLLFQDVESVMYDSEFNAFFNVLDGYLLNNDKSGFNTNNCYDYLIGGAGTANKFTSQSRLKEGLFFSSYYGIPGEYKNSFIEKDADGLEYFVRPLTSDTSSIAKINVYSSSSGEYGYGFLTTFVRIVDGNVVAESNVIGKAILNHSVELDGTATPFSLYREQYLYPADYYDLSRTGTKNFYTHIRYYRTEKNPSSDLNDFYSDKAYYLTDYDINDANLLPGSGAGPTLNLNISDTDLISDSSRATLWQGGYQAIQGTTIACSSSGFFLCRNESKKNELIYCPIGSGDNRKYLGWYNPLYQYASVDGDITQMRDMGSYVLITTKDRSYYIDTVNYIEDEGQRSFGIFTPILPSTVLISDEIGVNNKQKDAFIKTASGSAIALTSTGEIREFSGYQWGPDITVNKVQSITKGKIYRENLYCQAAFVNDAYFLGYVVDNTVKTLRLGTTEESGFGFSEFGDGGWVLNPRLFSSSDGYFTKSFFYNVTGSLCISKYKINENQIEIYKYSGDGFDKKLNKDIIDNYAELGYSSTSYLDIPSEAEFPEATGSSEAYFLYFLKANYFLRADRYSYKVTDENIPGYEIDDDDLTPISLSDATFSMDCRVGETEDIVASNEDFSPTSAVTMQREVQDHRVRMMLRSVGAGFQLTGMEAHFKRHDRTELSTTETIDNIQAINTGLFCHITEKLSNLAIGTTTGSSYDVGAPLEGAKIGYSSEGRLIDGTTSTVVSGPGSLGTGFTSTGDIEFFSNSETFTPYNYTIMFWSVSQFGNPNINKITTAWTTTSGNVFNGNITTGWRHFCYRVRTSSLDLYIDGVFDSTTTISPLGHESSNSILVGEGEYSDIRMYNKTITEEQLTFYIDNILNNQGDYLNGY